MLFNSFDFGIFFPVVFFLYWLVFQKHIRLRNIFLIIVSYIFYGWWDWRFLSLIVISSLIDFYAGKKIDEEEDPSARKKWLWISVGSNLGILGFFKYYNFFVDSFIHTFTLFGFSFDYSPLNIILPVGISFYTFQTLSYTLDIYFKKIKPSHDIFAFMAFVSFFPQLVAGPIERAKDLLPQFTEKKELNYDMLRSGLLLMAWGFFKKIVIADRLARFVDTAYEDPANATGAAAVLAVLFFGFQLYLDFSAYSDIALGSARTFGFNLSLNFKRPYLAASFADFWKRWHISLSSWFKDYVYIPLGGNKAGQAKTIRNIIIVFLLSGLWHGASWNFVIWGAINSLFIIAFDRFLTTASAGGVRRILTSFFISTLWMLSLIFFRAQTFGDALTMFGNLFKESHHSVYEYGIGAVEFKFTIWILLFFLLFEIIMERGQNLYDWFTARHFSLRWTVYLVIVGSIIMLGSYGLNLNDSNFIYFQF